MARRVALIGPVGIGYEVVGAGYPRADSGVACEYRATTIVWDAPIVARILRVQMNRAQLHVICNHLAATHGGRPALAALVDSNIAVHPVGKDHSRLPGIDIVFNDRVFGTRTWFSLIDLPSLSGCVESLRRLAEKGPLDAVYLDSWFSIQELADHFEEIKQCTSLLYVNLGDCADIENVLSAVTAFGHERVFFQASSKTSLRDNLDILCREASALSPRGAVFLLTAGGEDALMLFDRTAQWISVEPLSNIVATGAGAYVSARFLGSLLDGPAHAREHIVQGVKDAVTFATRQVALGGSVLRLLHTNQEQIHG
jgi:hypothetical protein